MSDTYIGMCLLTILTSLLSLLPKSSPLVVHTIGVVMSRVPHVKFVPSQLLFVPECFVDSVFVERG